MTTDAAGQATAGRPTRVFIYGSCVSRDTFEYLPQDDYALLNYVARQSLISAFGAASPPRELPARLSPFQRRMLQGDLGSALLNELTAVQDTVDLLLWDLTDERLGVYALPDGSYVTRSVEIVGTDLERTFQEHGRFIPFGTDEHLQLWTHAVTAWVALLQTLGLADRTLLLAPSWATRSSDQSPVPGSFGLAPERANALHAGYYDQVTALGVTMAVVPETVTVAAAEHRWGRAPFHYDDVTYLILVAAIDVRASELPPRETSRRANQLQVHDALPGGDPKGSNGRTGQGHWHGKSDYARWTRMGTVHTWSSIESFAAAQDLPDGIHRVDSAAGAVDLVLSGRPLSTDNPCQSIPVFLTDAIANRQGTTGPHFSGLRMVLELGLPSILIADTTLTHHTDLGLAWYAGCDTEPLQETLATLLSAIIHASRRPLLLVGGSGAGFAALALAAVIGSSASVFCWNPQTDLLSYAPPVVTEYLRSCFPAHAEVDLTHEDQREVLRGSLSARGIQTLAWPGATTDTRVLYIQNAGDWHVTTHMMPFVDNVGLTRDGSCWAGGSTLVALGNWGLGHAVPPREMLSRAVSALARGATAAETHEDLRIAFPQAFSYDVAQEFLAAPTFDVHREATGTLTVRAGSPSHVSAWLTFAYYILQDGERLSMRWYSSDPEHRVTGDDARRVTSVTCFARDYEGRTTTVSVQV